MPISFTDKRLYLKGTATAYLQDANNNIVYASDKFQTANISTSVTMGEIRAGIGNPVVMMIPTDSTMNVNFVAADFSLGVKAAQTGAVLAYGAPVMVCQTVTASGDTLSIDVSGGAPVAAAGATEAVCFVQEIGAASPVATGGAAYPISAEGVISGFAATAGTRYKVWYHITRANAQIATINSLFEPAIYRFTAVFAMYAVPDGAQQNEGTHVGNLTVIIPNLKLGGDGGGITGDQTGNDTSSITGQALAYDASVVSDGCDDCSSGGSPFAYYIYAPCDTTGGIAGVLAQLGGVISIPAVGTYQVRPRLVMEDGSLVSVTDFAAGFTYELTGAPEGTTVSNSGLISAGSTQGDAELVVTYADGSVSYTDTCNVSVLAESGG